jgi:hypothetical protein
MNTLNRTCSRYRRRPSEVGASYGHAYGLLLNEVCTAVALGKLTSLNTRMARLQIVIRQLTSVSNG